MKLYIYSLEDNAHVGTINGDTNQACEAAADREYGANDYGWTYSPAFGAKDGLVENDDADQITA